VATEKKKGKLMDCYDFTTPLHTENVDESFHFGIDKEKTAELLREIADKIDTGRYALQSARVASIARNEDFPITTVRISFSEKRPAQMLEEIERKLDANARTVGGRKELKHLYGASPFPVATAQVK
jgi:hypothetical protein